ncbi:putative potassium transport system protein Kup [Trichinella pseudospiralis]
MRWSQYSPSRGVVRPHHAGSFWETPANTTCRWKEDGNLCLGVVELQLWRWKGSLTAVVVEKLVVPDIPDTNCLGALLRSMNFGPAKAAGSGFTQLLTQQSANNGEIDPEEHTAPA